MKIQIRKFKRLSDLTVNVPAKITGGNEQGKTTILEAVSFCLTGKDLSGNEFKQIYDNRVDLHDAIADVSFFDAYGNEYRRTVEPVFQTSRAGIEEIKILRSTRCTKNQIDVKDFALEFQDFYKYGTDFFFNQKETDQRAIFIDLMKSKLPEYNVSESQLRLKTLKRTQKTTVTEIDTLRRVMKEIQNVEVAEISEDVQKQENEYQKMRKSIYDNQNLIAEINQKNNDVLLKFRREKSELENKLYDAKNIIENGNKKKIELKQFLSDISDKEFIPQTLQDFSEVEIKLKNVEAKLSNLTFYNSVKDYAKIHGKNNPVVMENMGRINRLKFATPENLPEGEELTDVCSCCGQSSQAVLDKGIESVISNLKAENKQILQKEMREVNNEYLLLQSEQERLLKNIQNIKDENSELQKNNDARLRAFQIDKSEKIELATKRLVTVKEQIKKAEIEKSELENQIEKLKEPALENLPVEITISDELKKAHEIFNEIKDEITSANAINNNNQKIKQQKEIEIKEKQILLIEVDAQIIELQNEISDYFSNLKNIVETEFSGKIKIGVELQEYVISRDEYRDVFKITADGKVFPYECNGALQNNTKLQILASLQRLSGYVGITIMDNIEANTTQEIDVCGLNLVSAQATFDKELKIS